MVSVPAAVRANPAKTLSVATFLMHFGVPRVAETFDFTMFLRLPIQKPYVFEKVVRKHRLERGLRRVGRPGARQP